MAKSVILSDFIFNRTEREAKLNGYKDVSEYVSSVLEEVFKAQDEEKQDCSDDVEVKKRLRALGYKD